MMLKNKKYAPFTEDDLKNWEGCFTSWRQSVIDSFIQCLNGEYTIEQAREDLDSFRQSEQADDEDTNTTTL